MCSLAQPSIKWPLGDNVKRGDINTYKPLNYVYSCQTCCLFVLLPFLQPGVFNLQITAVTSHLEFLGTAVGDSITRHIWTTGQLRASRCCSK